MYQIDVSRRKLGVNFNNGVAEINIWAPAAKNVSILIEEKDTLPLIADERGYWIGETDKLKPGDSYLLKLDDRTYPDPTSLCQLNGVHEASTAIDLKAYNWTDDDWSSVPLPEYIIYELHTGTFTESGTFEDMELKLDYLKDLGITAIEIMPVSQFPGTRNWGYDGVYPFAVQSSYGSVLGLQQFVNTCHKKGLSVILDVVYNHMGPEGNYLGAYGPYFTDKYKTPWGLAINFDDAGCDGVRSFFIENALMWFRDFHIDALRLDAVHAIKDFGPKHILAEIKENVDKLKLITGKEHYLIVECDLNDTRFINSLSQSGYGMDAQWMDEFHHALRVSSGNDRNGYYSDFDGIKHLAKSYKDAYVYDGIYSAHRDKTFGTSTKGKPAHQFIVFSQNHDQVGNRMLGERTSQLVSFEMQKLMAGATILSPFLPLLFMGEEWAAPEPFLYFVSHTDPELAEAVRKGRTEEFAAFHIKGTAPDPMDEETFKRSILKWDKLRTHPHSFMHAYYKQLIGIRKSEPMILRTNRDRLESTVDESGNLITLRRWDKEKEIVMLLNFSQSLQKIDLLNGSWNKLLDSSDTIWNGPGSVDNLINPESIIVLKR